MGPAPGEGGQGRGGPAKNAHTSSLGPPGPPSGIQPIDLAAFIALALVWIFVLAMLYGIYKVLRSKARGDAGWGDHAGL